MTYALAKEPRRPEWEWSDQDEVWVIRAEGCFLAGFADEAMAREIWNAFCDIESKKVVRLTPPVDN
jgi:hypothetical protein